MTASRPCPEFEPMLLDRAAGSIEPSAAARLEAHLAGCEACRVEAAALEAALAAARLPPPSEAEQRALDRAQAATLRHWRGAEGSRRNRSLLQGFSAGFAVAAAAAVLVIAPGAYRRAQQPHGAGDAAAAVPGNAGAVPGNTGGAVPGNGSGVPGIEGAVPGNASGVPGIDVSPAATGDSDAGWEPDLDADWETAALALGDEPGDEQVAGADAADLYDFNDE